MEINESHFVVRNLGQKIFNHIRSKTINEELVSQEMYAALLITIETLIDRMYGSDIDKINWQCDYLFEKAKLHIDSFHGSIFTTW